VLDLVRISRLDYETARADLEATCQQSLAVAVMAWAWRLTAATLTFGLLALGIAAVFGRVLKAAPWIALAALAPLLVGVVVSFPLGFAGGLQSFGRARSREASLRFGTGGFVYVYYGWRYAFRGRRRPWGALSRDEKLAVNPSRFGAD
jgi:hypothetical protein